jgi:amidase
MAISEYDELDGLAMGELVRSRQVSAVSAGELLEEAIRRVEAVNPRINAVVRPLYDVAREVAARPLPDGPFAGVPFLLKDLGADLRGVPTTYGSRYLATLAASRDNTLVRRFRNAGVVFFGKTNTPEFGLMPYTEPALFGPTRNPWDLERTPGGSSGGAAAAVAAGIAPLAHANDGGGSIRIPAACCGLFGLKPSTCGTSAHRDGHAAPPVGQTDPSRLRGSRRFRGAGAGGSRSRCRGR